MECTPPADSTLFYAADNPGAAILSTFMSLGFVTLSLATHNFRPCRNTSENTCLLVSNWHRALATTHALLVATFEIVAVYGSTITDDSDARLVNISSSTVLAWIATNTVALSFVILSCASRHRYRVALYAAHAVHMNGAGVVWIQIASYMHPLLTPASGPVAFSTGPGDLVLPSLMLCVCAWLTYDAPAMMLLDADRVAYESNRRANGDTTGRSYLLVTTGASQDASDIHEDDAPENIDGTRDDDLDDGSSSKAD